MSVHYKFKSSLDFDTVTFDGLHISVTDLKKAIMQQKKIGKSADFELQITNAQTKEVYDDDETLVPKNTSVIVARVPVSSSGKKIWERGDIQVPPQDIDPGSHVRFDKLAKTADLANAVASEEEKIKAMMTQSSQEYDISKYVKSRSMTGPLPANYTCYRCGKPGHWIKNCPTNNPEIKRSTGIPRSFMVPVDGPEHKGALLTSTGDFAVPLIDHQAYKEVKKEKPPFLKQPEPEPDPEPKIPEDLLCLLCKDLLQDAVLIPCCGNSFCDECIRTYLLDSENHECPECHETDISPNTMIPSRFLRNGVMKFKNETGYIRVKALHPVLNEIHLASVRVPTPTPPLSVPDINVNTAITTAASSATSSAVADALPIVTTTTSVALTASPARETVIDADTTATSVAAATATTTTDTIITTTTTATSTITTTVIATISPSTVTTLVDCHTAVSNVVETTASASASIHSSVLAPVVVTTTSSANSATTIHSPYSSPAASPASRCNSGAVISAITISAPITAPCSPHDVIKESCDQAEELEEKSMCHSIVLKPEEFNSCEEADQNHTTENTTLEIELDDNQPGTPLADEPPVDLETEIPLESKLPVDTLQSSMGSPYDSSIPLDTHNDSSMSPTRDNTSGNSIATITTRGPLYMLSGLGFGRTQQNSRQYSARSNTTHEASYGSSRASRSSRSGYGTPPRERYRQARRTEHSNYKSSYGGYGSQSSAHMPRNYQSGVTVAPQTISSHGSQSRYGNQVQSHRVNIPPGYMNQNIQRPHAPLTGMQPSYPVQPPPAKHFERTEEPSRGILPLPHRVSNDAPYKRKLNSSPLEIHGQAPIPSQPPPPGVAPVLLSTPQPHGSIFPYQHDEFYHESHRLKDRNTVGDALDDFARQLMEYSREQQRRPNSRHCSRSRSSSDSHSYNSLKSSGWSHSGSRSGSHSSSRSRSRSFSSRSRSPSYRRSRSRSRSRSFSRSSHSRSRSVSRSRSRSRGRNSLSRKRSNSKSNSPKNFIRFVQRSPYQKKDYSSAFFNPPYHQPYANAVPHPGIPLDHFTERNRYYRDQYRPYDEYHNTYNSPRYEQHEQRYDPKYIQEYQRFDGVQHRARAREAEKYERGRNRDVAHRRENVSKPISEKTREAELKDNTDGHSKTRKKEEKLKHRKHHHKNKENRKEVKQDEHKNKEQIDTIEKTEVTDNQTKKTSDIADTNKKNTAGHDNKEKKHKHKRKKETDEIKKKKKSRELTRVVGTVSEKPIKSKKKKAKKEIGKLKVEKLQMQEVVPDKPIEVNSNAETNELPEQSPNVREAAILNDDIGLEEEAVNISNPGVVLEENINDINTPCLSADEQPLEGENTDSPKGILLEEHTEIKKANYEELEQLIAVDAEDEVDDGLNPEMTDVGEMAEKADSDEGVVHSDDANVPEISFELPEISKWEREEFDEAEEGSSNSDLGNLQEMKASLPSDIIQRAEKAILQKPLKDAIVGPPTSREKHRSLENKKISEKPVRSGETSRDSIVVVVNAKEKEAKSKEQGTDKEANVKDKPEEDSLQITISAEKNKRSVQTKSKSIKKEKSVDNSQNKKLKLDRSKFSDQLKSESLVSYADSSDNVATEKLYSSDSSKEFNSKSESASRKKENIVITKKEKERKCNIEDEVEKNRNDESSKRIRRSIKKSPSSKVKAISGNQAYSKHEIVDNYSEIKIPLKSDSYSEHDSDKRMGHSRKYNIEGRTKRRETSHILKEQKFSSTHSRELYREDERHGTMKQIVKRKLERSRSRSYDSNQSIRKGHRSRSQIKPEDRKRAKRRSPIHNSSSERKRLNQETEPFSSRSDSTHFENRTLKEPFLIARSRKESTQDEANFEPNYDETSDSDNSSEVEDSKRRSKHQTERRARKFEPVTAISKIDETEFGNLQSQEVAIRSECSNERLLKRRDRSNSSVSTSETSQTESMSSGTERSSRKRLRSNSPESDLKHRHRKSRHKKHKKHRHKHKRKKSHKYKQR